MTAPERVVGEISGRQSTTPGDERLDLASSLIGLSETVHSQQVVNARIDSHLIDDGDTGVYRSVGANTDIIRNCEIL